MVTPAQGPLPLEELERRAARIKLVLSDVDGVLTDAGVYYGDDGEVLKRFSVRDGMGMERLRLAGIESGMITRERSKSVEKRGQKLGLRHLYLGVQDKRDALRAILSEARLTAEQVAYIGDDVNDLGIIDVIAATGLTAAPRDAMPEVVNAVHHHCEHRGGRGAFREFAEWILALRESGRR